MGRLSLGFSRDVQMPDVSSEGAGLAEASGENRFVPLGPTPTRGA